MRHGCFVSSFLKSFNWSSFQDCFYCGCTFLLSMLQSVIPSIHPSILSDKFCKLCYQVLANGPAIGWQYDPQLATYFSVQMNPQIKLLVITPACRKWIWAILLYGSVHLIGCGYSLSLPSQSQCVSWSVCEISIIRKRLQILWTVFLLCGHPRVATF